MAQSRRTPNHDTAAHNIPQSPETPTDWDALFKRMAVRYLDSSRSKKQQEVARVTVRDVLMRLEADVSHMTIKRRMEESAERVDNAFFDDGAFVFDTRSGSDAPGPSSSA